MIFVKIFILSCCATVALSGGKSHCEPFYSNYYDFFQKFLTSAEQRKKVIVDDLQNFSFYANASIVEAEITTENYYNFFINVTSQLAHVSTDIVEGSINGSITEIPDPLRCVSGSFEIVKQILHQTINQTLNTAVSIKHLASSPSTSSNSSNCTDISTLFPVYALQLQQILEKRTKLNQVDAQIFAKYTDSLIDLNIAQNENQFTFMVTALADALHIDISSAKELISGHFNELPSTTPSPKLK